MESSHLCCLSLNEEGQAGDSPALLLTDVAIWVYLRQKLGLGDVGILIKLCVISFCASLQEFENVSDIFKLKSSRI